MQSHEDQQQSPAEPAPDSTPAAPVSHRKQPRAPVPPDQERLILPRGGLAAMRQSGGLRFGSREIVVYRSGKIVYRQTAPRPDERTEHASLCHLVELHHALQQSGMARLPATLGRQSPDALAYEIVARVGRVVRAVEVFQGSIPESLAPLIRVLQALMPKEDVGEDAPAMDAPEIDE